MAAQPEPDESVALVPVQQYALAPANLFGSDPVEVIERASAVATALGAVIEKRKLYKDIQGRKHVYVEGWTLLGSMLGVFPKTEWTRELEGGWEARVVAVTLAGQVVGAAESMCTHSEGTWARRDEYALRSMAQTRATSKAMRQPLGFVMQLAGYEATPADEMPAIEDGARRPGGQAVASSSRSASAPVARTTNPIVIKREVAAQSERIADKQDRLGDALAKANEEVVAKAAEILEGEIVEIKPGVIDANTALRNRALKTAEEVYRLKLKTGDRPRLTAAAQEAVDVWAQKHYSKTFGALTEQGLASLIDALETSFKNLGGKLPL